MNSKWVNLVFIKNIMNFDLQKIKKAKTDKIWFFRFKKFDHKDYIITNDYGSFVFLNNKEFWDFISWKINSWDKYEELLDKWFIKNESYKNDQIIKYANKNHFVKFWPSLHIVVTTLRCNHKCIYCHASAWNEKTEWLDMSIDTAQKVLDTIFFTSSNNITIEFQWWEPLLNWEVLKFFVEQWKIKASHLAKNINFALVSNLSAMDEEKLDYLLSNWVHISTSLDWDEKLHNENRVFLWGNSFELVTYWIKRFNEEYVNRWIKNIVWEYQKVWALLTVTKNSLNKYKEIIDTYVWLWLDWVFLRMLNPYWFASKEIQKLSYTHEEFGEFYKKSMDYIIDLNKKWINFREQLSSIYLAKIFNPKDPNYLDERSPCGACIWQLAYNYNGKIYSCDEWRMLWRMWIEDFMAWEIGENPQETYKSIISSELTNIMVQSSTIDWLPWYNDDVYKPYIWICPIYNYKTTGTIYANYSLDWRRRLENLILDYIFDKIRIPESKKILEQWIS